MKNKIKIIAILLLAFIINGRSFAQSDTLHLNYLGLQTKMHDTTEAKIAAWAKKLNGHHVEVDVIAYYNESEFKKYSAERCDELFLMLNRKARDLITIKSNEPKKGKKSQRSRVDVVYKTTDGSSLTTPIAVAKNDNKGNQNVGQKTNASSGSNTKGTSETGNKNTASNTSGSSNDGNSKAFVARDEFKSRKMVVVLLEESAEQIQKLSSRVEDLEAYKNNIKTHNDNITKAFKTFWKLSPVEFMKESALEAPGFSEKTLGWVLLLPGKSEIKHIPFMTYNVSMVYREVAKSYITDALFKVSLRNEMPDEADFLLLMHKMKVYYGAEKEFGLGQLEETLKSKTLYVDMSLTEMTKEEFKEEYPFPFVFSTTEEVKEKMRKAEKDALYFKLDVLDGIINAMIVNAENGVILARSLMSGFSASSNMNPFSAKNSLSESATGMIYTRCHECPLTGGSDIFKIYIEKAKIKKSTAQDLGNEKKQVKYSDPLTIF